VLLAVAYKQLCAWIAEQDAPGLEATPAPRASVPTD
jgi:hypothetical protein